MKNACALLFIAPLVCMTACEKTVYMRGYAMDFSNFKKIRIGKDDAQAVLDKVGSPTMRSSVEDEHGGYSWFYVSRRTEKNGFLDAKVTDRKAVEVAFNANGIVTSIKENVTERDMKFVKEETEASGKGTGLTNELFGGLGKYRERYKKD